MSILNSLAMLSYHVQRVHVCCWLKESILTLLLDVIFSYHTLNIGTIQSAAPSLEVQQCMKIQTVIILFIHSDVDRSLRHAFLSRQVLLFYSVALLVILGCILRNVRRFVELCLQTHSWGCFSFVFSPSI